MKKHEAREPLFHIVKRAQIPLYQGILIRAAAIVLALFVCGAVFFLLTQNNPIDFYRSMVEGAFKTPRRIWNLVHEMAILLCIALAVTPAFKMRFWNIGAEGQVLAGGLACAAVMFLFRPEGMAYQAIFEKTGFAVPQPLLWAMMIAASLLAGMIWAVIPAIFKANWNTNETLFTLMMNYIATQLVAYFINVWVKSGSGVLSPMQNAGLPQLGNQWILNILVVAVLTVALFIYLRFSKHGYEISVVGESENTARYIGVNVKKVILRTMVLSGAICGIAGLLLVGGTSYTVNANTAGGRGFTAIMVSWLAKFNPLLMVLTSFLIAFLQRGTNQVSTDFKMDNSISNIVTAIILFFIIGCEFFINYKIVFASHHDKCVNRRNIGVSIALSFLTFGVYEIYWQYLLVKNVRALKNDDRRCTGEMLCLLFVPYYAVYWWFTRGRFVEDAFAAQGHKTGGNKILYLVLCLLGLQIVSMAIMQDDFNSLPLKPASLPQENGVESNKSSKEDAV